MPRYFLTIRYPDRAVVDPEGSEFPDLAAAIEGARVEARFLSSDNLKEGGAPLAGEIDVLDEGGAVVGTVPLEEI